MEKKYTKAFKEVYVILNNSSKEEYDNWRYNIKRVI